MRPDYTIQSDWSKWEDHAKTCDVRALRHIIADCRNAAAAMRSHNTEKHSQDKMAENSILLNYNMEMVL